MNAALKLARRAKEREIVGAFFQIAIGTA